MAYSLTSTTDIKSSSSYRGYSGGNVIIHLTNDKTIYADAEDYPGLIDGTTPVDPKKITSLIPRHGQRTSSPFYIAPVFVMFPFQGMVPKLDAKSFNAVGYISDPARFYVVEGMWFVDQISSLISMNLQAVSAIVEPIISSFRAIVDENIVAWTPAPNTNFTGNYYFDGDVSLASLTAGGGSDTFIFCNGNISLGAIGAVTGKTTVIIATGQVTLLSNTWHGNAGIAGTVLILSAGNVLFSSNTADPYDQSNLVVGAVGTFTVGTAPTIATQKITYYTTTAKFISISAPVPVEYQGNSIAKVSGHSTYSTNGGLTLSQTLDGTISTNYWFTTVQNNGNPFMPDILQALTLQFQWQYGVTSVSSFLNPDGPYELRYSFDGFAFETQVLIQESADSLPNVGIHTEPFDFGNYLEVMAQSYRVDDTRFAFYKPGRYMTLSPSGDVVISPTDLVLPNAPYNMGTLLIDKLCTVSLSDTFPGGSPSSQGGMDPYVLDGNSWKSQYRKISAPPAIPSGSNVVVIRSNYDTIVNYAPKDGYVTDPDAVKGVLTIRNNADRRSKIFYRNLKVRKSSTSTASLQPGAITSHYYHSTANTPVVTFVSSTLLHFVMDNKFYSLLTGEKVKIGSDIYSFGLGLGTGILYKNSIPSVTNQLVPDSTVDVDVTLVIMFGDMFGLVDSRVESDFDEEYLARMVEGLTIFYKKRVISLSDFNINSFYRTQGDIYILRQAGFYPTEDDWMSRTTRVPVAFFGEDIEIKGCVKLVYPSGALRVQIDLDDGRYGSSVVTNGTVALHDLPITYGDYTYYGFEDTTQKVTSEKMDTTLDYFISKIKTVPNPIFEVAEGVVIKTVFNQGKSVFDSATGSGKVVVRNGELTTTYNVS